MNISVFFNNFSRTVGKSHQWSRILGRLRPLDFSHMPRYATEIKCANPLQDCDPYGHEILRNANL